MSASIPELSPLGPPDPSIPKAAEMIGVSERTMRRAVERGEIEAYNRYIVIDDLDICVVIKRNDEGGFKWEIRWRDGREPTVSKWIYVIEQTAIDEARSAVVALA